MHELHRILTEARDLVAKGWTQKTLARDAQGNAINAPHNSAVKFCAQGAIRHAGVQNEWAPYMLLRKYLGENVVAWNDAPGRTQAEVISLFNKVIFEEGGMSEAEYVLRQARALVGAGWIQGAYARDALGVSTLCTGKGAVSWCIVGALYPAYLVAGAYAKCLELGEVICALDRSFGEGVCVTGWNDTPGRTKEEVLAQFDVWINEAHTDRYWGLE